LGLVNLADQTPLDPCLFFHAEQLDPLVFRAYENDRVLDQFPETKIGVKKYDLIDQALM
jgi:hypothetical protein